MTLTDAQIDRYSRQIIVPRIGGRGQERLLAARMIIAGDARDIEAPLAYLVGAGVGTITLKSCGIIEAIASMRQLNPDAAITDQSKAPIDLALLIIGNEAARKIGKELVNDRDARALVIARLDASGKIEVIPDAQRSGAIDIDTQFGTRAEAADFIAMLATAEAFKLIADYLENPPRATIEFDGCATSVRVHP
jgi:hypothetical protein